MNMSNTFSSPSSARVTKLEQLVSYLPSVLFLLSAYLTFNSVKEDAFIYFR